DASHARVLTIDEIKKAGVRVDEIALGPLAISSITELLADTLRCPTQQTRPLAELLLQKTGGNPFFLRQLLRALHDDGLLELDTTTGVWTWDVARIRDVGITDNVVELMTAKLRRLPEATQDALKLAACIGNSFDLGMLSVVSERGAREVAARLWPAVREGLIMRLSESYRVFQGDEGEPWAGDHGLTQGPEPGRPGESAAPERLRYRFLHDRVQQATYALIPADRRKIEHLKIGRLLAGGEHRDEDLFDIVAHLNVGRDLLGSEADRLELARLNYRAGRRAKAATAMTVASEHFAVARELLPADRWTSHYELARDLHRELGECVYLLGEYDRSDELLSEAIAHGRDTYDQGTALECKMRLYLTQGPRDTRARAVATGLEALQVLGAAMPMTAEARAARVVEVREAIARRLAQTDLEGLAGLPRMEDPQRLLVMTTTVTLFGAAYIIADMDLLELCTYSIVDMSLDHGNSEASAFGYMLYGMLRSAQGEHRLAYELGRLGLSLHERYPNPAMKPKIHNIFGHSINPFINHFETNLPHYRITYASCIESGDLLYGLWSVLYTLWVQILKGDNLQEIHDGSAAYMGFVERSGDANMLLSVQCLRQAVQCLRGLTDDLGSLDSLDSPDSLDRGGFVEADLVRQFADSQNFSGQCWHALAREIVDVTFARYAEAVAHAAVAERTLGSLYAFFNSTTHDCYAPLALAGAHDDAPVERQAEYLARIDEHLARLRLLADDCPDNFLHCHQLV
ncbi:MAG TPA: hypothetical protein VGB85_03655, partial [Nannocystis sp.]